MYAFAHALHDLHLDICGSWANRLCADFKTKVYEQLVHYLAKVSFDDADEANFTFRFYSHNDSYSQGLRPHDGPPRYSVINFAKNFTTYDWNNVGTYVDGKIIDIEPDFETRYAPKARLSACGREECELNHIKIPDTDDQCCWHCVACGDYKRRVTEYECHDCEPGQRSYNNQTINETICVSIKEVSSAFSKCSLSLKDMSCHCRLIWITPVLGLLEP